MITYLIILGAFSGFLGGLLGIGGGVVTVPGLYYLLSYYGFPHEHLMQVAVATALASTCLTSLSASIVQWKRKSIVISIIRHLVPGLVIGCGGGAVLAYYLPTATLRTVFGLAALLLGPYFFFPKLPSLKIASAPNHTLSYASMTVGAASSLLGVGGGIFTVPLLLGYQVPLKNAVGTSSASTFITAILGSFYFLLIGWMSQTFAEIPTEQLGYIDIPAWLAVGLSSMCTAPIGARFSSVLPTRYIKRIFGCALTATGCFMLFAG